MAGSPDSLKPILYALFANLSIAIAKGVAAVVTTSGAMFAEAIHSLADTGNQVLLLFGLKQSKRPPTPDYPLGFGKSVYFWSFLVAVMLFSVGGVFSVYEGIHKLLRPEPLNKPWIAIAVLLFAIFAESFSLWGCMQSVNTERHGRGLLQWFRESRSSALIVVFGEDIAALLGLLFAIIAVCATLWTGNPLFDAVGTILIGALLLVIAVFVAIEVKALLIGQSVEPRLLRQMHEFFDQRPEIDQVFNLLTMQLGPDAMVAVKARMAPTASARDMITAINRVEADFRTSFPMTAWLFFEPDHADD